MHRQGQSKHRLSPTIVRLNGDWSIAETDTVIETRTLYGDIEVDTTANCRLFSRVRRDGGDRKSTRLNSSHQIISYAVFCLKKTKKKNSLARCRTAEDC